MTAVPQVRNKRRINEHQLQDWPDQMSMDENVFALYAENLEKEDFEDDIRCLSSSIRQLVDARTDTICKLKASAEYLDSIWLRCRVSRTMGTSASVVGGGLTIAGGILTTLTAGAAAPILIAGIATSSVGAATNIGTSLVEKILNSRQIKDMNAAFERDKDITLKLESQIKDIKQYKDSVHLKLLINHIQDLLGGNHLLITILRGILLYDMTSSDSLSAGLLSQGASVAIVSAQESGNVSKSSITSAAAVAAVGLTANSIASSENSSQAVVSKASSGATRLFKQSSQDTVKYSPLDAGVLVEGGKVIGQNSIKVAGQVIIGISAAFLVWDAIDLGFTISDLVRKQGSQAAKVLREKAETLELALHETVGVYSIELPE